MSITDTINAQLKSLLDDILALPASVKSFDVAGLQKKAEELTQTALGSATAAYSDLVKKSDDLVPLAKGLTVDDVKVAAEEFAASAEGFVSELRGKVEDVKVDNLKSAVDDFKEKADSLVDDLKDKADARSNRAHHKESNNKCHNQTAYLTGWGDSSPHP